MSKILVETPVRRAMLRAALSCVEKGAVKEQRSIINRVADAAAAGIGEHKVQGWNAHLSHRTFQSLKNQGVMV